jgi:hypothetical protein
MAVGGLALALLLPVHGSGAQTAPNVKQRGVLAAPPQAGQPKTPGQLPNYYFDQGRITAPKGPLGPGDIANSLRARGFNNIGPVQRRGNTSITEAIGPSGERVQLVIGPNGEIVGVRVLSPGKR